MRIRASVAFLTILLGVGTMLGSFAPRTAWDDSGQTVRAAMSPEFERQSRSHEGVVDVLGPVQRAVKLERDPLRPFWDVNVLERLARSVDDDTRKECVRIAEILRGVEEMPEQRRYYFSAYNQFPFLVIDRWNGSISSIVSVTRGGYVVTVMTSPVFLNSSMALVPHTNHEIWYVHDGVPTYLFTIDPSGSAGKFVGIASY